MSDITIVGLGLMGAALARALLRGGHNVTVWNRSPGKMQPLVSAGATAAGDAESAVAASPILLICIDNYQNTQTLLNDAGIAPLLKGRTVVQLSTGRPNQADEAHAWVNSLGAHYIDGAILAGPNEIDSGAGEILLCGDAAGHDAAGAILQCLAGKVRFLGSNIRAASALDLAWLSVRYGEFISVAHAANLCVSEGADLEDLACLFPEAPYVQMRLRVIDQEDYGNFSASLDVWGAALANICRQGQEAGISTAFPDFVHSYFRKASDAGFGGENVVAIYKVLRGEKS